jgi:acetyl esterase/lipase
MSWTSARALTDSQLFRLAGWLVVLTGGLLTSWAPARAAAPVEVYGKLPALDLMRLSPSGDRIAFVAVDGESRKLFIRKVNGDALLVSTIGTSKVRDLEWAGEDYLLIIATFTMKFGNGMLDKWTYSTRAEPSTILIANLKTGAITRVFEHEKSENFLGEAVDLGVRQIGGRWCDFVETYNLRFGYYIYRVDLETGASSMLSHFEGADYDYLIGADGEIAARARYDEPTRTWTLYAGDQGRRVVMERKSNLDTIGMAGFGRTPGSVLIEETGADKDSFNEIPIAEGASPTPLFEGETLGDYLHDPVTHLLLGATLSRGQGAVLFDPAQQRHVDAVLKAFPGLQVRLESYSADFSRMVVLTEGGDDPGTHWLVDMASGKAQDLMSAYPIEAKDVAPTRLFRYQASDGLALEGVLTLPPGSPGKGLPLVVIPHGGPLDVYDHVGFDFWAQAFASRGYAVLQPNYRGSGGYGAAFRQAGFGQWGHRMLTDISDGVAALASTGLVDSSRVCIVGASYGGYAALASVTLMKGVYRCAVSVSGVTDVGVAMLREGGDSDSAGGRYSQAKFGASFAAAPEMAQISPLRHAADASAPILLIHGKDDTVVPFVHSLSMNAALNKAGKPVVFVALEGEDHFWSHESTRVQILSTSVSFVEKYNPVKQTGP